MKNRKYHFYAVIRDGRVDLEKHYEDGMSDIDWGRVFFEDNSHDTEQTKEQFVKLVNFGGDGRACHGRPFDCVEESTNV